MTTIDLPDMDNWFDTPQWREHLLNHHRPVEGCPRCAVTPLMAEIYDVWTNGTREQWATLWGLQDGYGEAGYMPAQGYDWSGIRDSSPAAIKAMHEAIR